GGGGGAVGGLGLRGGWGAWGRGLWFSKRRRAFGGSRFRERRGALDRGSCARRRTLRKRRRSLHRGPRESRRAISGTATKTGNANATATEGPGTEAANATATEGPGTEAANATATEGPGTEAGEVTSTKEPGTEAAEVKTAETPGRSGIWDEYSYRGSNRKSKSEFAQHWELLPLSRMAARGRNHPVNV